MMDYHSFYFYESTHFFNFGESILIEVWTSDDAGNIGSLVESIIVEDYVPPKILNTGIIEYQNGTLTFWAEVEDGIYGSGLPTDHSSVILEYVFISNFTELLAWNGSENIYTYTVSGFIPGNAFNYRVSAYDNNNNIATVCKMTPFIIFLGGFFLKIVALCYLHFQGWMV